jgi:hypothetical protein
MFDLKAFSEGVSQLGSVLSTVKSVIGMFPMRQKEEAAKELLQIEEKLQIAEAQIAKGLGYELCKCTWPPQIMVHAGDVNYGERFRCPACGRVVSPDDMPLLDNRQTI